MTINIGDEYVISSRYGFSMTPWTKICKVEKIHLYTAALITRRNGDNKQ